MTATTVVFVGPTLSVAEARSVLPGALYLPPARCGDVLRALRLEPRIILIIDGTYERTPAVWHKEIAVALERGIAVYGAASMGALRAAEMASLGMIGVGGIFEDFRDGKLVDDDEVAVIHSTSGEALSTSMVDIRASVESARTQGELSEEFSQTVLTTAKNLFYPERTFDAILEKIPSSPELERFRSWLERGGQVQKKRQDALRALRLVADAPERSISVPRTNALRLLFRHAACSTFSGDGNGLPQTERVLCAARFLGDPFRQAKRLAELMRALVRLAPAEPTSETDEFWQSEMNTPQWAAANDCSAAEQHALRERVELLAGLERSLLTAPDDPHSALLWRAATRESRYRRWLDALEGPSDESGQTVRRLVARAFRSADLLGRKAGLVPHPQVLGKELDCVRAELGLIEPAELESWTQAHGLDENELGALLVARLRSKLIASESVPLSSSPNRDEENVNWLLDAVRLSGLYPRARALLAMDPGARLEAAIFPKNLSEALARDFDTDEPAVLRRLLL